MTQLAKNALSHLTAEELEHYEHIYQVAQRTLFKCLESVSAGMLVIDIKARIAWMNAPCTVHFGVNDATLLLGESMQDLMPSWSMAELVRSGQVAVLDRLKTAQGECMLMSLPLKDEAGEFIGAVGILSPRASTIMLALDERFYGSFQNNEAHKHYLREAPSTSYAIEDFIGESDAAAQIRARARTAAQADVTVLIEGETGTGKEFLARAIHAESQRAKGPFVAVHIAAISEHLFEAELFDASLNVSAATTSPARLSKIEQANGGTLFLNEIGDAPLNVQAKLLKFLQEHEFDSLDSNERARINVRIIAASSSDLKEKVAQGLFRADLYYHLCVLPIQIPALRTRAEDIPVLTEHFLEKYAKRRQQTIRRLSVKAWVCLKAYAWPGNVRELTNVLERTCLLNPELVLEAEDFIELQQSTQNTDRTLPGPHAQVMAQVERELVEQALQKYKGNVLQAAASLGISRATLYKKMSELNISNKTFKA